MATKACPEPRQHEEERRWAADSAAAAVALLHIKLTLPTSEDDVTPFLKQLWDVFAEFKPAAATVHSKFLDVATEQGEYYGVCSMCVPALKSGKYEYETRPSLAEPAPAAEGKGFVASTISPAIYGNADWQAREITGDEVAAQPCYKWHGDDCTTGEPYDVRVRPWYRHAVERGTGFTDPYADPVTGEGMVSYVAPLRRADGVIWGVVIAGSFLDSRGDAVEPDSVPKPGPKTPPKHAQLIAAGNLDGSELVAAQVLAERVAAGLDMEGLQPEPEPVAAELDADVQLLRSATSARPVGD